MIIFLRPYQIISCKAYSKDILVLLIMSKLPKGNRLLILLFRSALENAISRVILHFSTVKLACSEALETRRYWFKESSVMSEGNCSYLGQIV